MEDLFTKFWKYVMYLESLLKNWAEAIMIKYLEYINTLPAQDIY